MSARTTARLLVAVLAASSFQAQAQSQSPASAPTPTASTAASTAMADGIVLKVDKEAGKLTLRHGRIESLDMPGMKMVFRMADLKMLEGLKEGDKLRFSAERIQGAITITAIERLPQ